MDYGFAPVELGMAWYHLVQCAYNLDALVSLIELSFQFEWVNPLAYSGALEFVDDPAADEDERKRRVFRMMARHQEQVLLWTPFFRVKWSPTVRGDFREMFVHHVVTNALVVMSSYYRLTRTGSMIFIVHDVSDVPIDLSKLANFMKWKAATICCFVAMVIMWIAMRLYLFPFVICKSIVTEHYDGIVVNGIVDPAPQQAYYPPFYFLLGSLLLLHITWFLILLRIGWSGEGKSKRE